MTMLTTESLAAVGSMQTEAKYIIISEIAMITITIIVCINNL